MGSIDDHFFIHVADSFEERCFALNLVYRKYLDAGFISPKRSQLHFSLLDLLPTSLTWVAYQNHILVGTLSVVLHSKAGLPCGVGYEGDLKRFGIDGRMICEFTKLAVDETQTKNCSLLLVAYVLNWCMNVEMDDILCVVHPRHASAWNKIFGWTEIGELRKHSGVKDNPGILMHLSLRKNSLAQIPKRGQRLLEEAQTFKAYESKIPYRYSGCEVATLLIQRPEIFLNSPSVARLIFEAHYPWATVIVNSLFQDSISDYDYFSLLKKSRPRRDRFFQFANRLSQARYDSGSGQRFDITWDQLFVPEVPVVLLISKKQKESAIKEFLDNDNFISFTQEEEVQALTILNQHLFDLIITDTDDLTSEFSATNENNIWTKIRVSDALLRVHTPIISLLDILYSNSSNIFHINRTSRAYENSIKKLSYALQVVGGVDSQSMHEDLAMVINA
jgi:hypothetical protein